MNHDLLNLLERPYREVVDDLLVAIVGGVVNEPQIYDVKLDLYPLAEPAAGIRGITGTRTEVDEQSGVAITTRYQFQSGLDFEFSQADNALIWTEDGRHPDDETTFYVDYFRAQSDSPITDINVGSVTRTLAEAIGRETATVYQQINLAYLSSYVDTAEGTSLDLVVSILGISRKTGEFAQGLVSFLRDSSVKGNIHIPQGTPLATATGDVLFETIAPRTLQQGQERVDVPVRAAEGFRGEAGLVDSGAISGLVRTLAGISRVTNIDPTYLGESRETDEQLRARAKARLHALGKATYAALNLAIAESRGKVTQIYDPNSPGLNRTAPGEAVLLVETEPERFPGLSAAVHTTRAAGVFTTLVARYIFFKPRLQLKLSPGLTGAGKEKVVKNLIAALTTFTNDLDAGMDIDGKSLLEAAKAVEDVEEVLLADVLIWQTIQDETNVDPTVGALIQAVQTSGDDLTQLRENFTDVLLNGRGGHVGNRVPNQNLLQSSDDKDITPESLIEGNFRISAQVKSASAQGGEAPWSLVLDMEPADVLVLDEEN